ncbi:RAD52 family DNA repair protein [Synechococcus sp. UW140]|uniref:RAD52 family DNA repair protein n=2 Tax=Synechococcus sp. UW140 TaxID=368503 RepID=UPI003138203C
MFSTQQQHLLAAPLDRANVQYRNQSNRSFSYLEGWHVIAEANRIFGFDGWQRETIELKCVCERERNIGRDGRTGWGVTYTAKVRIQVGAIIREGSGAGHGIDADLGQAHESALKEAETDAMKRALMTFGNPFGLALYDKQQRQVIDTVTQRAVTQRAETQMVATQRVINQPVATSAGLEPLDPNTITKILANVKVLPKPALDGFTKAFRKRFHVPEEATSIADRINQKQHHDWIETYLVSATSTQA